MASRVARFVFTGVVFLLLGAVATVLGQGITGTIGGMVRAPHGAAVPGAKVVAKNTATGAETSTTSDPSGLYRLVNLHPGEYTVSAEAKGFKKSTTSSQTLSIGDQLR